MRIKHTFILTLAGILAVSPLAVAQPPQFWQPTLESARRTAAASNRLVLMYFTADWCHVCRAMEQELLSQPNVLANLQANFVPVKINADYFPSTAEQYRIVGLPTTVVTTPDGTPIESLRGRFELTEYTARLGNVVASMKRQTPAIPAAVAGSATPIAPPAMGATAAIAANPPQATSPPPVDRYADYRDKPSSVPGSALAAPPAGLPVNGSTPGSLASNASTANNPPINNNPAPSAPPVNGAITTSPPANSNNSNGPQMPPGATSMAAATPPPGASPAQPSLPGPAVMPPPLIPTAPAGSAATAGAVATAGGGLSPIPNAPPAADNANSPLALDGFCPVALIEKQQWIAGDRQWGARHRGRTYLFSGAQERDRFFADPDRFAPMVSGNDIVLAVDQKQLVTGYRQHGVFFGNRVYLFADETSLQKFSQNPNHYANQALQAMRAETLARQQQMR
jgi:thiol-disulfide isomerase/thioredoxin/YHS domain-containing protein